MLVVGFERPNISSPFRFSWAETHVGMWQLLPAHRTVEWSVTSATRSNIQVLLSTFTSLSGCEAGHGPSPRRTPGAASPLEAADRCRLAAFIENLSAHLLDYLRPPMSLPSADRACFIAECYNACSMNEQSKMSQRIVISSQNKTKKTMISRQ